MPTQTKSRWRIGKATCKRFFITVKGRKIDDATIPITIVKCPIIFTCDDGSEDAWVVVFHRNKFGIHYPDSVRDVDDWGYYRPNGKKFIKNSTGLMTGVGIVRILTEKFGKRMAKSVILEMAAAKPEKE